MDPLAAAVVAGGVAWLSIFAAAHLPSLRLDLRLLRVAGGLSIGLVGLAAFGIAIPAWSPLVVLVLGIGVAAVRPRRVPAPAA